MPGKGLVECILFAELEGEEFHVDMEASAHVEQAEDIETGNAQLRSNQADVKYKALAEKMCEASANMDQVKTYQETHGPASSSKDATMGGPQQNLPVGGGAKEDTEAESSTSEDDEETEDGFLNSLFGDYLTANTDDDAGNKRAAPKPVATRDLTQKERNINNKKARKEQRK